MLDSKPFVDKAESESGQAVLAHGEARLRVGQRLGDTGLLCAIDGGLVFVEEDVLDPGEVTLLEAKDVQDARLEEGFLDASLIVDTGAEPLVFDGMKLEEATAILERARLSQEAPVAGVGEPEPGSAIDRVGGHDVPPGDADPLRSAAGSPLQIGPASPEVPGQPPLAVGGPAGPGPGPPALVPPMTSSSPKKRVGWLYVAVAVAVGMLLKSLFAESGPITVTVSVVHHGTQVDMVDVSLDDNKVCSFSPCTFSVEPGSHYVTAQSGNLVGAAMILALEGQDEQVVIPISEKAQADPLEVGVLPATLELTSPHTDMHVFLDGVHKGKLPLVLSDVTPGQRTLRFRREGLTRVIEKRVELRSGQVLKLSMGMAPDDTADGSAPTPPPTDAGDAGDPLQPPDDAQSAFLNCNSIPPSMVVIDGRPMGRTPVSGIKVEPGAHVVMFLHDVHGRKARSVTVAAGQTRTVTTRFPRTATP